MNRFFQILYSNRLLSPFTQSARRSLSTFPIMQQRKPSAPYREERIVVSNDGCIVCCWHPEPKFPYEFTRPIPRSEISGTPSPLKIQVTEDMKELYHHKPERFHRRDLMKLTWTTKHRWFPNRKRREQAMHERKNPREKPFL